MTATRKSRLEKILEALLTCGGEVGCSRLEIAEMLGLKKTPHITQLLNQVVADGWALQEFDLSAWPHRIRYTPSDKLKNFHPEQAA